jgi:hypothetical protein
MVGLLFLLPVPAVEDAIERNQRHDGKNAAQPPVMPAAAIAVRIVVRVVSIEPAIPVSVPKWCRDHTDDGSEEEDQKKRK